jgi:hypothetical protein
MGLNKRASYQPPCTLTPAILRLVAEVAEAIGRLSVQAETDQGRRLRRIHRIRTIQGSLAIEGNTLSEELRMILDAVSLAESPQVAPQVNPQVERLLQALVGEMSREVGKALTWKR